MAAICFQLKLMLPAYTALWYNSSNGGGSNEDFIS